MKYNYRYFFLLIFFVCITISAQEKNSGNDSVKIYKKIENYSKKSKFNKFIYSLLFKSERSDAGNQKNARKRF